MRSPEKSPEFEQETITEDKREQAPDIDGILRNLSRRLETWKLAFGLSIFLGVAAEREAGEPAETRISASVELPEKEIKELDRYANAKDIARILDTYPAGYIRGDLTEIRYTDEVLHYGEIHSDYGEKLKDETVSALAVDGGDRPRQGESADPRGTTIRFYKSSRNGGSVELWKRVTAHELGHANDWDTDSDLNEEERDWLRQSVLARSQAEDRFQSPYVEAIENPDAEKKDQNRAKEYWGEIVEAYLDGFPLPEADEKLVDWSIKKNDPNFNRFARLDERNKTVDAMQIDGRIEDIRKNNDNPVAASFADWAKAHKHEHIFNEFEKQAEAANAEIKAILVASADDPEITVYAKMLAIAQSKRVHALNRMQMGLFTDAVESYDEYQKQVEELDKLKDGLNNKDRAGICATNMEKIFAQHGLFMSDLQLSKRDLLTYEDTIPYDPDDHF